MKEKRKELAAIFFCIALTTVLAACGGKMKGRRVRGILRRRRKHLQKLQREGMDRSFLFHRGRKHAGL